MFSAEQLALLSNVKARSGEQSWAAAARAAVETLRQDLFTTRCTATQRNMLSLDELGADALTAGVVVSFCEAHHVFHLYRSERALNAANNIAVSVQSRLDSAAAEMPTAEVKQLRGRVVFIRNNFYAAVQADESAMVSYRRFGLFNPAVTSAVAVPAVTRQPVAAKRGTPAGLTGPLTVRREQARRVLAEIGITDTQLIEFYRCYRKRAYTSVAAAINSTMLVHDGFELMNVYLCGHCGSPHIGHRSARGDALTPAFFTRAIAKWEAMPEVAARYLAETGHKTV